MRLTLSAMVIAAGLAGLSATAQAAPVPTTGVTGASSEITQVRMMRHRMMRHRMVRHRMMRNRMMRRRMMRRM